MSNYDSKLKRVKKSSYPKIVKKIIAAHQTSFIFFNLQELFDEFDRNTLF